MAIKYRVSATFDLSTEIEPEGVDHKIDSEVEYLDGVEDFNSNSYFSTQSVTCDGGQIDFVIPAEDEDDAERKLRNILDDGSEYEDHNGFTWVVESISIDVEALEEEEPTVEEAIEILKAFISESRGGDEETGRVATAARVVLDDHTNLTQRVFQLETRVRDLDARITELSARLAQ